MYCCQYISKCSYFSVLFWMGKDCAWNLLNGPMWIAFLIPTVIVAWDLVYLTFLSDVSLLRGCFPSRSILILCDTLFTFLIIFLILFQGKRYKYIVTLFSTQYIVFYLWISYLHRFIPYLVLCLSNAITLFWTRFLIFSIWISNFLSMNATIFCFLF